MNSKVSLWTLLVVAGLTPFLEPAAISAEQKSTYVLAERSRDGVQKPPMVLSSVSPLMTYDLPDIPLSFRVSLRNPSMKSLLVRNPLPSLQMIAFTPDARDVGIPQEAPGLMYKPPSNKYASPIRLVSATMNGAVDEGESDSYEIPPQATLDLVLECRPIVGERILASLKGTGGTYIDLRIAMLIHDLNDPGVSAALSSERMRLAIPRP